MVDMQRPRASSQTRNIPSEFGMLRIKAQNLLGHELTVTPSFIKDAQENQERNQLNLLNWKNSIAPLNDEYGLLLIK